MRAGLSILALSVIFMPLLSAQQPAASSVEQRLAAQKKLFDESWQMTLKMSPMLATSIGDYRFNNQLGDFNLASVRQRHAMDLANLTSIQAIDASGFPDQDRISHDLFLRQLQQRLTDYELKEYEMPITTQGGLHTELADLPLAMPFDTVQHYDDYIARLKQFPRALTEYEEILRAGVGDHLVMVRFLAEKIPGQCNGIVAANPFLIPTRKFPASFSDADKQRLTSEINDAISTSVMPAYKQFAAFVVADYIPAGRTTLSIESLPEGKQRYQNDLHRLTTTSYTPAEIHSIGLKEYDRIIAEMTALAKRNGYADLPSFRTAIEANPRYKPTSAQQIVDDFAHYIHQMEPKLPELFTVLPKSQVTVEAIPAFQSAAATHYQGGTPDGKRPGRVSVAVSDLPSRTMIDDEATAYHEGVPGHHMQISVAQTIPGLPEFRKHGGNSGYIEGWALYAEQLGKEVGFYQDPGSDYGRLNSELFRAVRLVVDTGIHDQGWTREQVVDFMRKSHSIDEPTIQAETDRYISWPGQACAYKLGQLDIRKLRNQAQQQLGPKFDIRTFHDEILSGGALPLDVLDARVGRWISAQLPPKAGE